MKPNTLYITISLPPFHPYQPLPPSAYRPNITSTFNPKTYETSLLISSSSSSREEFSWGIYWLDAYLHGTLYTLSHVHSPLDTNEQDHRAQNGGRDERQTINALTITPIDPVPLLFKPNLITLLRVLTLTPETHDDLSPYLTWLTHQTAPTSIRSFIWATTSYVKCRAHILRSLFPSNIEDASSPFDVNGFLVEALGCAYMELPHRLVGGGGGGGRAAVWDSEFGVEVVEDEEFVREREEEEEKERERVEREFERAWPRLTDVYSS